MQKIYVKRKWKKLAKTRIRKNTKLIMVKA